MPRSTDFKGCFEANQDLSNQINRVLRVQKGRKTELGGSGLGVRAQGHKKPKISVDSGGKTGARRAEKVGVKPNLGCSEAKESLYIDVSQSTQHSYPKSNQSSVENQVPEEETQKGPPFGGNQLKF